MCWTAKVSCVLAITSFATASYAAVRRESFLLWIPLLYAGLMELLQGYTYLYLGKCDLPQNQLATYLSYLHISFQPLFMNMAALYFIPEKVRGKIAMAAMAATGIHSGIAFAAGSMETAVVAAAAAVVAGALAALEHRHTRALEGRCITPHRARVEEWPIQVTQWFHQR